MVSTNHNYSRRHFYLGGDLRPADLRNNDLRNALFGYYSTGGEPVQANLIGHVFRNCWLSGIYCGVEWPGTSYRLGDGSGPSSGSWFFFPTASSLPATTQVSNAISNDLTVPTDATYGVRLHRGSLEAHYSRFEQLDSVSTGMNNYQTFSIAHPGQIGIAAWRLSTVANSRFYLLDTGIDLGFNATQSTTPEEVRLLGNGFVHCRVGVEVTPPAYYSATGAYPFLNMSCNTIRRNDTRQGTSIGVHIKYRQVSYTTYNPYNSGNIAYPGVRIDDPAVTPANSAYMKNYFDDGNVATGGTYRTLQNDQLTAQPITYRTYGKPTPSSPGVNYAAHDYSLSVGSWSIAINIGLTQGGVLMQEKAGFGVADAETPTRAVDGPGKWFGRWRGRAGAGPPTPGSNR
jgi:hypothetical protein